MDIINYTFTGADDEIVPLNATHLSIHESVKVIPNQSLNFSAHPNMTELILHHGIEKIGPDMFRNNPRLQRVIMQGVTVIEAVLEDYSSVRGAFHQCRALTDVECPKLERIGPKTFCGCTLLSSINLTSVRTVEEYAFVKVLKR